MTMKTDRQSYQCYQFIFSGGVLVFLTLVWLWPGIGAKAPAWMGAVDGFMLAKARFFSQGLGLGSWNDQWFLGIPSQHVGSPLLAWILSLVTGLDPAFAVATAGRPVSAFGVWRSMVVLGVVGSVPFRRKLPARCLIYQDH